MPEIGQIKRGKDIGKVGKYTKFIWHACEDCGKERWVSLREIPHSCSSCAYERRGAESKNWKGGRIRDRRGYIGVRLQPNDFFYSMINSKGYVLEHRLVMAKHLGRCLQPWEIVHHKNGIRDDNQLEGLQCITNSEHNQITILESKIKYQRDIIKALKIEVAFLKRGDVLWPR